MAWNKRKDVTVEQNNKYANVAGATIHPSDFIARLVKILLFVALIVLAVSLGRWAYVRLSQQNDTLTINSEQSTQANKAITDEPAPVASVKVEPSKPTTPTQSTPTVIPNTGSQSMLGIFVVSALVGTILHYRLIAKRL